MVKMKKIIDELSKIITTGEIDKRRLMDIRDELILNFGIEVEKDESIEIGLNENHTIFQHPNGKKYLIEKKEEWEDRNDCELCYLSGKKNCIALYKNNKYTCSEWVPDGVYISGEFNK
jgi:hypothetical protein